MEVICIQEKAFYALLDRVFKHLETKLEEHKANPWIDAQEVMEILRIKSTTTLQKMRDNQEIRFSQPSKRVILYDRTTRYVSIRCPINCNKLCSK